MKNMRFKVIIFSLAFLVFVLLVLGSPLFSVKSVKIIGNERITDDVVKEALGLASTRNIFFWDVYGAKKRLKQNKYVENVTVERDFIEQIVTVRVKERILSGYVEFLDGTYLYIDENGRVLEVNTYFTEKLPVVVGLEFSKFTEGEVLEVDNKACFNMVVTLAQLFNKYEMGSEIIKVDVSNINDIHLFIGKIDVEFGDIQGADEKVRTVKEIIENHLQDRETPGFLNIKDVNKPARFRLLQ